ncbi:MAG: sulfatase [Flavobacteriales bacterium CG18_big_fil_WC_8_21_14_2_50_32_9]|nr:MAG: sulfatase [Flavobacteriales bacterium CG18_big_fil_WC_8_21_14_2_50_32_9]
MPNYLSHIIPFFKRIGLAFLVFMLCRIFFYIVNAEHFTNVSITDFIYGIRFDAVAISYLYLPFIILSIIPFSFRSFRKYQRTLAILFYTSNSIAIVLNLVDVAYFDFTLKRTTTDLFSMIGVGGGADFIKLLPNYILDFWYDYILLAFLIWGSWYIYKKYCRYKGMFYPYVRKNYLIQSSIFVLTIGLLIIGIRGGIQLRPLSIVSAGQFTIAQNTSLVLNTPFTVLKTLVKEKAEVLHYFSDEEVSTIFNPEVTIEGNGMLKNKNVVFIIIESLAKEYVGFLNDGNGYTPFLDSLMKDGFVFTNAYANGQKSIESLPSILTGIPQLMATPFVVSNYAGNSITGLPQLLKENGYNTSFYHAGTNGTMGFDAFSKIAGVTDYYGLNEYPEKDKEKDYDGLWGVFDEPYLQYYAKELNQKKAPFFSSIFTISSHHPYTIPKEYIGKFPEGLMGMHKVIGYTDYALKKFFETAQKMPWFSNTLFVFVADHSTHSIAPKYNTPLGRFAIPIFFYDPSQQLKGTYNEIYNQIDLTPSVLGLLGINTKLITFGKNIFNSSNNESFSINYINEVYQLFSENYLLFYDGETVTNFYNIKEDVLLQTNLILQPSMLTKEEIILKNKLERKIKAIIQQYNNRLIFNQLSINNFPKK